MWLLTLPGSVPRLTLSLPGAAEADSLVSAAPGSRSQVPPVTDDLAALRRLTVSGLSAA